jgi:hypothetical protein
VVPLLGLQLQKWGITYNLLFLFPYFSLCFFFVFFLLFFCFSLFIFLSFYVYYVGFVQKNSLLKFVKIVRQRLKTGKRISRGDWALKGSIGKLPFK